MKISKYLHSCLVFELDGYKILFDPGDYSFMEGFVTPQMFADVNIIIVTHIHADHFVLDILKNIIDVSGAAIVTNTRVGQQLDKAGISYSVFEDGTKNFGPFKLQAFPAKHELIMDNPLPQMTGFLINDKVLHPVDSMENNLLAFKNIELLIMVTMAPFASEVMISAFADKLQPKQILPVHDGYAKEFFVKKRYAAYINHFDKQGIKFHEVYKAGDSITI
ncbi:MBL fold metallo-hydrolase [Mucilaginibacter sp. SP1R1]|uniref:MBL fold metallo-hydrolase n=1 Tax=Mucilaginibacter sp. SP1R1 TaxID=2723091 RepID=UPI00161B8647|nr:MBL fold metallo-hydrolase [Mucilaginibacter sp. SP1R1]MBB6151444.1 L-ascorbate metabolism protein UlaG (beta-lactamase superfamily) [Mucilaginibacter sp. SP1R1]